MSQQFCLKWNNHMNNMMDVFKNLLSTEAMVDVTLACDGLSLKAHKIVLSACSPFFQSLFLENPCKHPIVILKDMKYTELKAIIEFMYHGEVNVDQDQLSALMKTAETLRVKGLAKVTNEKQSSDESSHRSVPRTGPPPPKRRRCRTRKRSMSDRSDDAQSEPKIKQPDSTEELSGDMDSFQYSSSVPMPSHSTNSFHKSSQQEQPTDQGTDESFVAEEKFGVEPSKLPLEQTLTTDDLPRRSGRSSVQSNMELQRLPRSSTDHSTSLLPVTPTSMPSDALVVANQQPESPPGITPTSVTSIGTSQGPPPSPVLVEGSQESDASTSLAKEQVETTKPNKPSMSHPPMPSTLPSPDAASMASFPKVEFASASGLPRTPAPPKKKTKMTEEEDSDGDSDNDKMSSYEKMIEVRRAEKSALLQSIGINELKGGAAAKVTLKTAVEKEGEKEDRVYPKIQDFDGTNHVCELPKDFKRSVYWDSDNRVSQVMYIAKGDIELGSIRTIKPFIYKRKMRKGEHLFLLDFNANHCYCGYKFGMHVDENLLGNV